MVLLHDVSITCRNFKCFGEQSQGFDQIKPLNIIIGRNNSGKSTLLDLIQCAVKPESQAHAHFGHLNKPPQVYLSWELSREFLNAELPKESERLQQGNSEFTFPAKRWAADNIGDKRISLQLLETNQLHFSKVEGYEPANAREKLCLNWVARRLQAHFVNPFRDFQFRRILADRDIVPEQSDEPPTIQSNGEGVTNAMQRYLNAAYRDRTLIERTFLDALNEICWPDAKFTRISALQIHTGHWEVYLDERKKGRVPLSQTGSGLKTILVVLANLFLVPKLVEPVQPISSFLFAFEELENNLHPAIQRRLFWFLRTVAVDKKCYFFVTTHSSVVIDLFRRDPYAQILHVTHDGLSASVKCVETASHGWSLLDDLDVRASDVLQTNVVVWVEGPSDRIYFNKWIELWTDKQLVEGFHYQCLPLGGSSNANVSFESPDVVEDLIAALRINRNAIFLADSDRENKAEELKSHTARLASEVVAEGGYAWITQGKEIENYIPISVHRTILGDDKLTGPGRYTDVLKYLARHTGHATPPHKTELARKVANHLTKDALTTTLDMAQQLDEVCKRIREWNKIDASLNAVSEEA